MSKGSKISTDGGGGLGQNEMGDTGLRVSGRLPGIIGTLPMVIGKIHDQQMSVIGLTNVPVQAACALTCAGMTPIKNAKSSAGLMCRMVCFLHEYGEI